MLRSWNEYLMFLPNKTFRKSLNDDALDHWDHGKHKVEQKRMLDIIFSAGERHRAKNVCIVSGDVHTAGAATIEHLVTGHKCTQLISSASVHSPPKPGELNLINLIARSKSSISGYSLILKNFGTAGKKTIRDRNFGWIEKSAGQGLNAHLETERSVEPVHRMINKFTD